MISRSNPMMLNYIYTTFLTILYTLVMSLSLSLYLKERKRNYLLISLYFLLLILNGLIVTMSETFQIFANDYNRQFMVNPIIETIYYLATFGIALKLVTDLFEEKVKAYQYGLYIGFALWLIAVPFMSNSALKVWLYYLPSQLLTVYLGIYLLSHYRQVKQSSFLGKYTRLIGIMAIIFGLSIVVEDTFIIYFRDIYHTKMLKIHNRNVSEDLFHISLCIIAIKYFLSNYQTENEEVPLADKANLISAVHDSTDVYEEEQYYFDRFMDKYGITQREGEILQLLLQRKHNQEIANQLYLSLGTVKTHTHNIFIKLQVERRSEVCEVWEAYEKSELSQ